MSIAAAELASPAIGVAQAGQERQENIARGKSADNKSFISFKKIEAGVLRVGYADEGPRNGRAVILLHGWPYDIHSFVEVAPILVAEGYRVIVPYLRGYGTTRILSSIASRNGQPSALSLDVIDLMDALKIDKAIIGGFDWGARSAAIVAALWPERCEGLVSVSGYLIGNQRAGRIPLPRRPSCNGGINFTSRRNAAKPAMTSTAASLRS